jgi:peroxiredoxin Q/BCP
MLSVGDEAPDFETIDESGNTFRLSDYRGKRIVVYFYPKDDSYNCKKEACSFRDHIHIFEDAGINIFGISGGTVESHKKFKDKNSIRFPLLVDENHEIARKFGAYSPIKIFGREFLGTKRMTFLIGQDGRIQYIFGGQGNSEKVKSAKHAQQVLKYWRLHL